MPDKNLHRNFSELILKYLSGNASDAEVVELEVWILADLKNKKEFVDLKKTWMLSALKENSHPSNVNQLWKQTSEQLFKETPVVKLKPKQNRRRWLSIAAAILVLAVASIWLFKMIAKDDTLIVQTKDQVKEFKLSDGSQIILNQSSTLDYTSGKKANRNVILEGDAFFDVVRDEAHPFIIKAKEITIEVLGTSFYVDARKDQSEIQVIVKSGLVAVRHGSTEVILKTDEKAIFNKSNQQLLKEENKDANYLAIKTSTLHFNKTKLKDVVFALNRQFHQTISIENPKLNDCELTATYKDKSLKSILLFIEQSLGIKVNQTSERIILTGTKCK